jgi:hypothetical protein
MILLRCMSCDWIQEASDIYDTCPKCRAYQALKRLTEDEAVRLIDCGEVVYCKACQILHSGPMAMDVESVARG